MGDLPVLKPAEVVTILRKLGFVEVRQRGSHKQFRDSSGRCTTVPFHSGRDIAPTLLRQNREGRWPHHLTISRATVGPTGVRADAPVRGFYLAVVSATRRSTGTTRASPS